MADAAAYRETKIRFIDAEIVLMASEPCGNPTRCRGNEPIKSSGKARIERSPFAEGRLAVR